MEAVQGSSSKENDEVNLDWKPVERADLGYFTNHSPVKWHEADMDYWNTLEKGVWIIGAQNPWASRQRKKLDICLH